MIWIYLAEKSCFRLLHRQQDELEIGDCGLFVIIRKICITGGYFFLDFIANIDKKVVKRFCHVDSISMRYVVIDYLLWDGPIFLEILTISRIPSQIFLALDLFFLKNSAKY